MPAITKQTELALLGQDAVLRVALEEARLIVPLAAIEAAEEELSQIKSIDTEEECQRATALAGKFSGWSSKITEYWKGLGKPYYERYKMFGRAASDGVFLAGIEEGTFGAGRDAVTIVGSTRLDNSKIAAESKVKQFIREKSERDRRKQEQITKAVESDVKSISEKIADAADNGDMATARELMRERDMVAQVPTIVTRQADIGAAAQGQKFNWSLAPNTGLMDLIKAIADGTVPLYHEVTVKGDTEMRPLLTINEVVVNQKVRAMGKSLNWPGMILEEDISLRTEVMMIRTLRPHEIFVFGSNTSGRHGKGAALQARTFFGAKQGTGEGITGQAYAFPTLDHKFQRRSMREIMASRDKLYDACDEHPEKTFLLTRVGCGLAGFPEPEMAELFTTFHPTNLVLPEDWE